MEKGYVARETQNDHLEYKLSALASPNEIELLCPIKYLYDYLPYHTRWLKLQPISLNRFSVESKDCKSVFVPSKRENSICLHTQAAKLPLHTGLRDFRQNKYWRANEEATKGLLELFAKDRRCGEVILSNRASMSSLAESQLKTAVSDTYCRFSIYMFVEADENRIQLLGQSVVLIFMFDGEQKFHVGDGDGNGPDEKRLGEADFAPDVWENASPQTVV